MTSFSGLALPVVLWTVAALSLLLGNFVQFARVEVQMASTQLAQLQADALRTGAVKYVIQALKVKGQVGGFPPVSGSLRIGEKDVQFELVNATGLIDLNYAEDSLLKLLIQRTLNWAPDRIESVLAMRRTLAPPVFPTLGDAKRLLGLSYREWLELMPFITVQSGASGVNLLAAPLPVLHLLRPDNSRAVLAFDQARRVSGGQPDLTLINSPFHQVTIVGTFRLDVDATLADGRHWPHRYWVTNADQPSAEWRVADHQSLSGS